ncbi:MAG: 30S ribosomal protein S13 [Candidatus Paceibacterota bacterium]|nr:MAG: 30S ribosomal protein S13 [Candidatus Paceibacterota bacterium]
MPRIFGVQIPDNKKVLYALQYLYGVGLATSKKVLTEAKVDGDKRAQELSADELNRIQKILERDHKLEGDLRKEIGQNIKRYKEIGTLHGSRLARRLPLKGNTRRNSRTTRGNVRKTMGSGRKDANQKT